MHDRGHEREVVEPKVARLRREDRRGARALAATPASTRSAASTLLASSAGFDTARAASASQCEHRRSAWARHAQNAVAAPTSERRPVASLRHQITDAVRTTAFTENADGAGP